MDEIRRAVRRRYVADQAFEFLIAFLAVTAAITFALDPDALRRSSVGIAIHPWDYAWNALYGLGGLAIVIGLIAPRPRIELAGLSLLASAVAINMIAALYVRGYPLWLIAASTYVAVVIACGVRAWILLRGATVDRALTLTPRTPRD